MVLLSLPRCPPRLESNLTVDKNILLPTLQTCRNDIEMKLKWGQLGKLFSCILYHVIHILRCQPVPCIKLVSPFNLLEEVYVISH